MASNKSTSSPTTVKDITNSAQWNANVGQNITDRLNSKKDTYYDYDEAGNLHWSSTEAGLNNILNAYNSKYYANQLNNVDQRFEEFKQGLEGQYNQMIGTLQDQQAAQQESIRRNTQATVDSINSSRGDYQDAYQKALKEAYINNELQKSQMGDYLSAMGFSGGLSESTLNSIKNNYQSNRQNAASQLSSANKELDRLVAEAQNTGNTNLANAANEYYNNYLNVLNNQLSMNYQLAADKQAALEAQRNYELNAQQNRLNQQKYIDDRSDYSKQLEQQRAEQDFNTFLNTYSKKYGKKDTYEKWIQNLQGMSDPYGYNAQKIDYLRQYINSTFNNPAKITRSSGASTGVGTGGGADVNNLPQQGLRTLTTAEGGKLLVNDPLRAITDALYGSSSYAQKVGGKTDAINLLKKYEQTGIVTPAEAAAIAKKLGLA